MARINFPLQRVIPRQRGLLITISGAASIRHRRAHGRAHGHAHRRAHRRLSVQHDAMAARLVCVGPSSIQTHFSTVGCVVAGRRVRSTHLCPLVFTPCGASQCRRRVCLFCRATLTLKVESSEVCRGNARSYCDKQYYSLSAFKTDFHELNDAD